MNGRMTDIIRSMAPGKTLMCWTGTLYDRKHPNMRCDSVRLLTVTRRACLVAFRATAGYRRAAVKDKAELCESDYSYVYDLGSDLRIITGATDRAGRFALPEDLREGEESQSATDHCLVDLDARFALIEHRADPTARRMARLFDEYVAGNDVLELSYMPVPDMVLVASRDARVFSRSHVGEDLDEPLEVGGKLEYPAGQYYGQGVLAMRPGYPAGHWRIVPENASVEGRKDITVIMNANMWSTEHAE